MKFSLSLLLPVMAACYIVSPYASVSNSSTDVNTPQTPQVGENKDDKHNLGLIDHSSNSQKLSRKSKKVKKMKCQNINSIKIGMDMSNNPGEITDSKTAGGRGKVKATLTGDNFSIVGKGKTSLAVTKTSSTINFNWDPSWELKVSIWNVISHALDIPSENTQTSEVQQKFGMNVGKFDVLSDNHVGYGKSNKDLYSSVSSNPYTLEMFTEIAGWRFIGFYSVNPHRNSRMWNKSVPFGVGFGYGVKYSNKYIEAMLLSSYASLSTENNYMASIKLMYGDVFCVFQKTSVDAIGMVGADLFDFVMITAYNSTSGMNSKIGARVGVFYEKDDVGYVALFVGTNSNDPYEIGLTVDLSYTFDFKN